MAAWWAAAQLEQALNRGQTNIRWVIELNNAFTLVSDDDSSGFTFTWPPTRSAVDSLRAMATSRGVRPN